MRPRNLKKNSIVAVKYDIIMAKIKVLKVKVDQFALLLLFKETVDLSCPLYYKDY
jgi:hypothetical protein